MSVILLCMYLIILVVLIIALKGNNVIGEQQINLINAIGAYKRHYLRNGEFEKASLVTWDVKDWSLIDCACPWRWYYDNWVSQEQLNLLMPFLDEIIFERQGK